MAVIESLIFGIFVIISIKFYELMVRHFEMKRTVDSMVGPKELPLIGILVKSMRVDIFEYVMQLKDDFVSPVKFWFGPTDLVVVVDKPNDIKAVLTSENALDKAPFYKFFNMGNGLFVSDKKIWKVHRKILSRAFNKNQLENSIPVLNEKANELVMNLSQKPEGKEFDMLHEVINGVLESIFVNFFDLKCITSIKEKYVDNAEK
jgi:cytochrome P450